MCGCFIVAWVGSIIVAVVSAVLTIIVASVTPMGTVQVFSIIAPIVAVVMAAALGIHSYRSRD